MVTQKRPTAPVLSENARVVLEQRILDRDEEGQVIEDPAGCYTRVARALAEVERKFQGPGYQGVMGSDDEVTAWHAGLFYRVLAEGKFLPNSPTLANLGTRNPKQLSLSACYVLPVPDSLEGIFDAVKHAAMVHQSGGGCLSGDSQVLTTQGPVRLRDLVQNEFPRWVFSRQPDGSTARTEIGQYHTTEIPAGRAYDVRASGFRIQASDWHPLFVWDGQQIRERRTDAVREGDVLVGSTHWAGEIPVCDQEWWLLGVVVSGGAFDQSARGLRLRVVKSAEQVVARVAEALGCQSHLSSDQRYRVPAWEAVVVGPQVGRMLAEHFGEALPLTGTQTLPRGTWDAPLAAQLSLLVGLLDGGGTYNKAKRRFEYSTVSDRLADEIVALAGLLGLRTTRRVRAPRRPSERPLHEVAFARSPFLWDLVQAYSARYEDAAPGSYLRGTVPLDRGYRDRLDACGFATRTVSAWREGILIDGHRVALQRWLQTGFIPRMSAALILRACGEPLLAAAVHGSRTVTASAPLPEAVTFYDLTVPGSQTYLAGEGGYVVAHNTGFAFSRLRPEGSIVRSTSGVASGPVSFMRVFNAATEAIRQGGKRRGANMGILDVHHPDIEAFVDSKTDHSELTNFNISVAVTQRFMEAVKEGNLYPLLDPRTKQVVGWRDARTLWRKMIQRAHVNGDPGLFFVDRANAGRANPVPDMGPIESTNPCLLGSTRLLTRRGLLPMEDLVGRPGVEVWTPNGWRQAEVWQTGRKAVVRVTLSNGQQLVATPDHRIMVGETWREAGEMMGAALEPFQGPGEWGGDTRYSPRVLEALGILQAEGFSTDQGGFYLYADRWGTEVRELFATGDWEEDRRVSLPEGHPLTEAAKELGIGPMPRGRCQLPQGVWGLDSGSVSAFLRGLFSAGGSVSTAAKRVFLRSDAVSSDTLLREVQLLLLALGFRPHVGTNRLLLGGSEAGHFADRVGFLQGDRQQQLESLRGVRPSRYRSDPVVVTAVEALNEADVYDFALTDTHAGWADGLLVHNCGEQALYDYDSCNLGSINLAKFYLPNTQDLPVLARIDWRGLSATIFTAVRMLDDVIEVNTFPLPEVDRTTREIRRIGLGVMGWADLLFLLGVRYGSKEALFLADELMGFFALRADQASMRLAEERGVFPAWDRSIYAQGPDPRPLRNATRTTVAPTGTLSIIADCSGGIEPAFSLAFIRQHRLDREDPNGVTRMVEVNPVFARAAKDAGIYSDELICFLAEGGRLAEWPGVPSELVRTFVTAHEVTWEEHVRTQAAFQRHVDNGISKTINFPKEATVEEVEAAYWLAYEQGCQGITIYRDGSREFQVLSHGVIPVAENWTQCSVCLNGRVVVREGCHVCDACGSSTCTP